MIICMIAAMSENHVIWVDNKLPWHYKEDLQRFKARTKKSVVIMWRWTYESIGKPLPNRRNIVISRTQEYDEVEYYNDPQLALDVLEDELGDEDEVFIIWGESLYTYFLDKAERLYLTEVKHIVEWDTFFPEFGEHFEEVERDVYNENLDFVSYRKKRVE
jgi:dihydrofolate reductase